VSSLCQWPSTDASRRPRGFFKSRFLSKIQSAANKNRPMSCVTDSCHKLFSSCGQAELRFLASLGFSAPPSIFVPMSADALSADARF
jgi:hypothetical protein